MPGERRPDFGQQLVAHHAVADLDRCRIAFGIRPAVTLNDDAIEAEKHAAIGASRIHAFAQSGEGSTREYIADLGAQRRGHRRSEILADLAGCAFGGLERDVAGKALGDDDVDLALADIIALDKALIVEFRKTLFAKDAAGLAHVFETLDLLDADIEEADGRAIDAEQNARRRRAHDRKINQMSGIGADRGADIEHDRTRRARSATAPRSPAGRGPAAS